MSNTVAIPSISICASSQEHLFLCYAKSVRLSDKEIAMYSYM